MARENTLGREKNTRGYLRRTGGGGKEEKDGVLEEKS